jgi:hypothetical protein
MERGEIKHDPRPMLGWSGGVEDTFNMNFWNQVTVCGTVHCIGGWAERLGHLSYGELDAASDKNLALEGLFYPHPAGRGFITVEQAAIALRSYLTTGDAKWAEALA